MDFVFLLSIFAISYAFNGVLVLAKDSMINNLGFVSLYPAVCSVFCAVDCIELC